MEEYLGMQLGQLLTAWSILMGCQLNFKLVEFGERSVGHSEEKNGLRQQLCPLVDCIHVVAAFL